MFKPADDLPTLFRSLGPDDSGFKAAETAASREAAQRWPLFQTVSPSKPLTTPTLSTEDRERWSRQEKQAVSGRKPALSLPGLSDKMAESLGRMAGPKTNAPVKNVAKRAQPTPMPAPLPVLPVVQEQRIQPVVNVNACVEPVQNLRPPEVEPERVPWGLEVPKDEVIEPLAPSLAPPVATPSDNSLASIFNRLEEKQETTNRTPDTRSSFLTRMGKR